MHVRTVQYGIARMCNKHVRNLNISLEVIVKLVWFSARLPTHAESGGESIGQLSSHLVWNRDGE